MKNKGYGLIWTHRSCHSNHMFDGLRDVGEPCKTRLPWVIAKLLKIVSNVVITVEVMKGYLTIFNNEKKRIGWMPAGSCIDIQA